MELLLNLVWLTLALPAVWIWRQESAQLRCTRNHRRIGSSLLLMCVLVLLFPVVSASDDLHPMRPEMEESNPFKRTVKQLSSNTAATSPPNPGSVFAGSILDSQIVPSHEVCARISPSSSIVPELRVVRQCDSRAPPSPLLG
jgi:hypothetical protein